MEFERLPRKTGPMFEHEIWKNKNAARKRAATIFAHEKRIRGKLSFFLFFLIRSLFANVSQPKCVDGGGTEELLGVRPQTTRLLNSNRKCGNPQPPLSSYRLAENTEWLTLFPLIASSSHGVLSCFKGRKDVSTSNRRLPQNPKTRNLYGFTGKQAFFLKNKLPFGMSHISPSQPTTYRSLACCYRSCNSDD